MLDEVIDMNEIEQLLKETPLFQNCNTTLQSCDYTIRPYQKGELVSTAINREKLIGIIKSGSIDVYTLSVDSTEVKLRTLTSGACFGICNLFSDEDIPTILKCASPVELLCISKKTFSRLLKNDEILIQNFIQFNNEKIQFLLSKIEDLTIQSAQRKLIHYLLLNSSTDNCVFLSNAKEHLAKELAISRASLFKELSTLQKDGLITTNGSYIYLLDVDGLRQRL